MKKYKLNLIFDSTGIENIVLNIGISIGFSVFFECCSQLKNNLKFLKTNRIQ